MQVETYHIYTLEGTNWIEAPSEYLPNLGSAQHLLTLMRDAIPTKSYRIIKRTLIEDIIEEHMYIAETSE